MQENVLQSLITGRRQKKITTKSRTRQWPEKHLEKIISTAFLHWKEMKIKMNELGVGGFIRVLWFPPFPLPHSAKSPQGGSTFLLSQKNHERKED